MRCDERLHTVLKVRRDLKCPKCKSDDIEIPMRTWAHKIEIRCNTCNRITIIEKKECED